MRAYARRNAPTAERVFEIDKSRLEALMPVFHELAGDPVRARKFALAYYLALGGVAQTLGGGTVGDSIRAEIREAIADVMVNAARKG
jgi:hypothetical protein